MVHNTQQRVGICRKIYAHNIGIFKVKLYKGNVMNAGITSPYTLYDENVASFGEDGGAYNQADSAGFINLFGLPIKVKALLDAQREKEDK